MRSVSLFRSSRRWAATAALVALGACNTSKPSVEGSPMPPSNLPPAPPPVPPSAAAPSHAPAMPSAAAPAGAAPVLRGKLLEKIDAPSYSYLRVATPGGETWAAVPTANVAVGAEVTITGQMVMNDFESKTLNRKFDSIVFGTLEGGTAAPAPGAAAPPADPHAGAGAAQALPGGSPRSTVPADIGDLKVPRAAGADGRIVSEVFAQRGALKDRPVSVRGKVVKYTADVMGKNWIHIRDASGSDATQDNDLTATTADEAKVGDVVLVKGTVHLDRDFGAGYKYNVIVEDAKLSR